MLPDIRLDTENFEEIVEKARKMIPGIDPNWTDFNYHDPGMTFLELFAWMKEMQQFHMDQIGDLHRRKYLKLLGISPRDLMPAKAMLTVRGKTDGFLLRGSRFYADSVCFETAGREYLSRAEVLEGVREDENGVRRFDLKTRGGLFRIPVFGKSPKGGETFALGLSAPLAPEVEHHLYVQIFDGYPVKRNPVEDREHFIPLAKISVEVLTDQGYQPVSLREDETQALLFSGYLRLSLDREMKEAEGNYWLRLRLLESGYETAPEMEAISLHTFPVIQVRTLAESCGVSLEDGAFHLDFDLAETGETDLYLKDEKGYRKYEGKMERIRTEQDVLFSIGENGEQAENAQVFCYEQEFTGKREIGEGTGFPFQEYDLGIPGLCRTGFLVMAETSSGSGFYREWTQVEDFDSSGPEDLHYRLEDGKILFGDCFHGCAPEGRIFIGACRMSLGAGGNVKAGAIGAWDAVSLVEQAVNEESACGGAEEETLSDCGGRMKEALHRTERAVTYEDYEELVRRTPGIRVRAVKAVPVTALKRPDGSMEESRVAIAVAPYSEEERKQPSPAYLANILQMLEPRRMIGVKVQILPSEYIGISVFVEVTADSYYERVRREIGRVLARYFEKQGWDFGRSVRHSEIYGLLDTLPGVTAVRTVTLDAKGKGVKRNRNGDLLLPASGLAYLRDWECMISSAE